MISCSYKTLYTIRRLGYYNTFVVEMESGAAPLMLETKKRFEELTGGRIIDAYSLTESALASVFTPILGTYKHGSVGIPIPDVEVRDNIVSTKEIVYHLATSISHSPLIILIAFLYSVFYPDEKNRYP